MSRQVLENVASGIRSVARTFGEHSVKYVVSQAPSEPSTRYAIKNIVAPTSSSSSPINLPVTPTNRGLFPSHLIPKINPSLFKQEEEIKEQERIRERTKEIFKILTRPIISGRDNIRSYSTKASSSNSKPVAKNFKHLSTILIKTMEINDGSPDPAIACLLNSLDVLELTKKQKNFLLKILLSGSSNRRVSPIHRQMVEGLIDYGAGFEENPTRIFTAIYKSACDSRFLIESGSLNAVNLEANDLYFHILNHVAMEGSAENFLLTARYFRGRGISDPLPIAVLNTAIFNEIKTDYFTTENLVKFREYFDVHDRSEVDGKAVDTCLALFRKRVELENFYKANPEVKLTFDKYGRSALTYAAIIGDDQMIEIILGHYQRNFPNQNLRDIFKEHVPAVLPNARETATILTDHEIDPNRSKDANQGNDAKNNYHIGKTQLSVPATKAGKAMFLDQSNNMIAIFENFRDQLSNPDDVRMMNKKIEELKESVRHQCNLSETTVIGEVMTGRSKVEELREQVEKGEWKTATARGNSSGVRKFSTQAKPNSAITPNTANHFAPLAETTRKR